MTLEGLAAGLKTTNRAPESDCIHRLGNSRYRYQSGLLPQFTGPFATMFPNSPSC
jgi:hypothetical protein